MVGLSSGGAGAVSASPDYTGCVADFTPDPVSLRVALYEQLSPETTVAVRAIVEAASAGHGGAVYAAGGAVRDLVLERPVVDIDLVTEADAIDVVRTAFPDARLTTHAAFRTASVQAGDTWIDVATARTETYPSPGALPAVATPAPIDADLARRDFAMNAIALRLDGDAGDPATLVDPCGGLADVSAGVVRVLHDRSFQDDATRIFRAFRYAARLGFAIEPATRGLIDHELGCIATIGGERLRRELELALDDTPAGAALEAMEAGGVLAAVHPALSWDRRRSEALEGAERTEPDRAAFGFALLAASASSEGAEAASSRLHLTRTESTAVRGAPLVRSHTDMLRRADAKPSGIVVLLEHYPAASIRAFEATTQDAIAGQVALRYLQEWRGVKPILSGEELIEMGVPRGPHVGQGLHLIRAARLDGWAQDRGDEQALARRFIKSIRDSDAMHGRFDFRLHVN